MRIRNSFSSYLSSIHRYIFHHDHFSPHAHAGFEGFYSRTQLDEGGGTLAIIFCWVKNAPQRRNLVHVSYTAPLSSSLKSFKYEVFPDELVISKSPGLPGKHQAFKIYVPQVGIMEVDGESVQYSLKLDEHALELDLKVTCPVFWSEDAPLAGPMGILILLSRFLPLNWHVFCTSSKAAFCLAHAEETMSGTGVSHVEKNWGTSFPAGWIWSQSFALSEPTKTLCLAGGAALPGIEAYLVGYRSPSLHWDFRPPFAVGTRWFSPFMAVHHDSKAGTFRLTVQTFRRKLVVKVDAPEDSFMGLAAPLPDGHRPMFAFESFVGKAWVGAWIRSYPWQDWTLIEEGSCGTTGDGVPCSALEFGGMFSHLVEGERR